VISKSSVLVTQASADRPQMHNGPLGNVHVVYTAGLSPAQASTAAIIAVDLVGAAIVLEEISRVIAFGGSAVVIASQAGHMLPPLPRAERGAGSQPCRGARQAALPPA
jgi:hypothetical protein